MGMMTTLNQQSNDQLSDHLNSQLNDQLNDQLSQQHIASMGFEAARRLGASARHGHSFWVTARCDAPLDELQQALVAVCGDWQMCDLNDVFLDPSDMTLAQYIGVALQSQLSNVGANERTVSIELRSAPNRGVRCEGAMVSHWLLAEFSAAHFLPNVPEGHQCGRLHGHGFKVKLSVDAHRCAPERLAGAWQNLHAQLHHSHLNHIKGLENPTSENLTEWLWQRLKSVVPLHAVEVFETSTAGSRRDATGFTIWKEVRFEAAKPFDSAGRYTGHSYLARLYLHGAAPDPQAGWLRDFADVKAVFKPIYNQLDHYALDTVADLADYDSAALAAWMATHLRKALPELSRVDLFENERGGAAVFVQGGA